MGVDKVRIARQSCGVAKLSLGSKALVVSRRDVDRQRGVTFVRLPSRDQDGVASELQPSFSCHADHPAIANRRSFTSQRGTLLGQDLSEVN